MSAETNDGAGTERLSLDEWRSVCQRGLDFLGELARIHLTIYPPTRKAQREEPEWIFRLNKVCTHVLAINGWEIEAHIEHVMASELRAAYRQMEVVWRQLPEEYRFHEKPRPDWSDGADNGRLAIYDHPTPASLALPAGQGGFSSGEDRASYAMLCGWLFSLAFGYGPAVKHLAEVLGNESDVALRVAKAYEQAGQDHFGLHMP